MQIGVAMDIEIITTQNKTPYETGFGGFDSCRNVLNSIKKMGHNGRVSACESIADLKGVLRREPDLVLLAVKCIPIENDKKIWLSEYFANHGIAYSGSARGTLEFDSDKILAKLHLREKGVSTAAFFTTTAGEFRWTQELPLKYPIFLKPNSAANGNGIDDQSYVNSFEDFEKKVFSLEKIYGQPVLAEEFLTGKEFTASVTVTKSGELLVSAVEIEPPKSNLGHRILSAEVKASNTEVLKKITDRKIYFEVRRIAFEAFVGLGVEGFGRIDIKSNADGKCFFMEANLVPGMTAGSSYFPEAFRIDLGLSYNQIISYIVEHCVSRKYKTLQRTHLFSTQQSEMTPHIPEDA